MLFKEDVINKKAKYHFFIQGIYTENQEQFQVTKYSILSNTEEEPSVIYVIDKWKIPSLCKTLGLSGKAIYVGKGYALKGDPIQPFEQLQGSLVWLHKELPKEEWSKHLMVFNLDVPKLYTLLDPTYKLPFLERFNWISRSNHQIDLETGNIKTPMENIVVESFSKAWWKEYLLFIKNVLEPQVRKLL